MKEGGRFFSTGFSKASAMTGFRIGYCLRASALDRGDHEESTSTALLCAPILSQGRPRWRRSKNGAPGRQKMKEGLPTAAAILSSAVSTKFACRCHSPKGSFYAFPNIEASRLSSIGVLPRACSRTRRSPSFPGTPSGARGPLRPRQFLYQLRTQSSSHQTDGTPIFAPKLGLAPCRAREFEHIEG